MTRVPVRKKALRDLLAELAAANRESATNRSKANAAKNDAERSADLVCAFADAVRAAEKLIAAGYSESAQDVLATMGRVHITFLRHRVAREPGGVDYQPDQ